MWDLLKFSVEEDFLTKCLYTLQPCYCNITTSKLIGICQNPMYKNCRLSKTNCCLIIQVLCNLSLIKFTSFQFDLIYLHKNKLKAASSMIIWLQCWTVDSLILWLLSCTACKSFLFHFCRIHCHLKFTIFHSSQLCLSVILIGFQWLCNLYFVESFGSVNTIKAFQKFSYSLVYLFIFDRPCSSVHWTWKLYSGSKRCWKSDCYGTRKYSGDFNNQFTNYIDCSILLYN